MLVVALSAACTKRDPAPAPADAAGPTASAVSPTASEDAEMARVLGEVAGCDTFERREVAPQSNGLPDLDSLLCPADVAFHELQRRIEADDDYLRSRRARLTRACGGALDHPNRFIRRTAHDCVADQPEALGEASATRERLLEGLEKEKDERVRPSRWKALGALDPTATSASTTRALVVARAHASDDETLVAALEALRPRAKDRPTAPEVVAFAREIARTGRAGDAVVELVMQSALSPAEACEVHADVAAAGGKDWTEGLVGASATLGRCKGATARIVDAVVARTARAKAEPDSWTRAACSRLRIGLDLGFSAPERTRLRTALKSLSPAQRQGYAGDAVAEVLERLR